MRWTSPMQYALLTTLAVFLSALPLATAPSEKRLSVYSSAANYSLPIVQRDGRDYVGLLELLDPLGAVRSKTDGSRWRLYFDNKIEAEFINGKSRVRIQGRDTNLDARFILEENDRGLVPLSCLGTVLPRLLGGPVTLHEASDRLFIGGISTHFTAIIPASEPTGLVFQFTSPVGPSVSTQSGGLRLRFTRDPVVSPASPLLTFGNKIIPSATYSESNGMAEIFINSTAPLIAAFSRDNRTITVTPASVAQALASPGSPSGTTPASTAVAPLPAIPTQIPHRYFAVLDASHGGDDLGEAISGSLLEKDLTLSFTRHLREQLQKIGITVLVLRDSDASLTHDQRAAITNSTHPALYIALHVSSSGHGVRLFTALLPYSSDDRGPFRAWDTAQSSFRPYSLIAAAGISSELQRQQIPTRTLTAPQRPLGNITAAALAVEIAPQGSEAAQLASPDYQQTIAIAIATGIASVRDKLGSVP